MRLKINELKLNNNNPRIIKEDKFKKLVKSIREFPEMLELRPIVIDEDNVILGGNMRYRACQKAGIKEVPIKIAKGLTEDQKREFVIKDNASFGDWEWDILGNEWNTNELDDWGVDVWQNIDDIKNPGREYSQSINTPIYEPKGDKPEIKEIYNQDKTKDLIKKIKDSGANKEEKEFLIKAAQRHIVFNYSKIAEFYAHSNKEIQDLMEDSALIIIDFNKAIDNGYVELTEFLMDIQKDNERTWK